MGLTERSRGFWTDIRGLFAVAPQARYTPQLPDDDADDLEVDIEEGDAPPEWSSQPVSGRTVVISYSDSKGQRSERQIVCRRIETKADKQYLFAQCLVRDRPRSFRVDRITAVMEVDTGEVHDPGSVYFAQFSPDAESTAPFRYGLSPRQYGTFNAALNVMAFMARCDGQWHPLERDAIDDFATAWWIRAEVLAALDLDEVARHASRLSPDPEVFWVSLRRCAGDPLMASLIRRHVSALIDADGVHHANEMYWGAEIDAFLCLGA